MKVTPAIAMASRYFRIRFRVNDVNYVSGNWTKLFYVNPDYGLVQIVVEFN